MDGSKVTFKTTVNGLIIDMNKEGDFQSILENIESKIKSAGKFFNGASLSVKYRGRDLSSNEEIKIHDLLVDKTGANIKTFDRFIESRKKDDALGKKINKVVPSKEIKENFFKGMDEGMTKFCKGTVRSGQLVKYNGNVVVFGDVNPGGEIIANGNIAVMGSLRGMVHAGAEGDKLAYIIAMNINPVQIRIADIITRAPDDKSNDDYNNHIPEIAYINNDTIYIEPFLQVR